MRNTAPAQSGSALDEGILAASTCRFGFDAGLAEERREGFAERFMRAGYEARLQEENCHSPEVTANRYLRIVYPRCFGSMLA